MGLTLFFILMKITIIFDNTAYDPALQPSWGFSALIEVKDKKILFDTGDNGNILISNMKKLNIDPAKIDEVFISHNHYDHIGGLSSFLSKNKDVTLYIPPSLRGIHNVKERIYVDEPTELHENIYSTGELANIEQSLIVKTSKGLVIIVGCSHPGVGLILETARQFGETYAIIGGFHGFKDYTLLEPLTLVCPTHCTEHIKEIKKRYPEKYVEGGAGRVIEIK
ncbi:MBL fold metallo-hydrolase [bacterium]|nr:MAG: MBL fold metallo-hydrolase [bacterium]